MEQEESKLMDSQNQIELYLDYIEEAMSVEDEDEIYKCLREGMLVAQDAVESLEEAISHAEDPDLIESLENAIYNLGISMDQGDQALETADQDISEHLSKMIRNAEQSAAIIAGIAETSSPL